MTPDHSAELSAIGECVAALESLPQHVRLRVLVYLLDRELRPIVPDQVDEMWTHLGAWTAGVGQALAAWGEAIRSLHVEDARTAKGGA